jgi:hypothetical protein
MQDSEFTEGQENQEKSTNLQFNLSEVDSKKKYTSARNVGGMTPYQTTTVINKVEQAKKLPSATAAMALIYYARLVEPIAMQDLELTILLTVLL